MSAPEGSAPPDAVETATPEKKKGLDHLVAATEYSLSGVEMAAHETAVRHEVVLGVIHFAAVLLVPFAFEVKMVLSLAWCLVVIAELLNTAVETVVDIACPERHPLAKRAKDVASAAVFVSLVSFFSGWGFALLHLLYIRYLA